MLANLSVYNFKDCAYQVELIPSEQGESNGRVVIRLGDLEIDLWEGTHHDIRELCEKLAHPLRQLQGDEQFAAIS